MQPIERFNPIDAQVLSAEPQPLMTVFVSFDPRDDGSIPTVDDLVTHARAVLRPQIISAGMEFLRQRIRHVPGDLALPFLEDDPAFDVGNHVSRYPVDEPVPTEQIAGLLIDSMSRPLDIHRPLWRVEIVTPLDDGSFGLLAAMHHGIGDGMFAFMTLAFVFFDFTPDPSDSDRAATPWTPAPAASSWTVVKDAIAGRVVSKPGEWRAFKAALSKQDVASVTTRVARIASYLHDAPPSPPGPFHRPVLSDRPEWHLHDYHLSLLDLRIASRAFDVTIMDLLLAATAHAWPSVNPGASSLTACVPVSLRPEGAAGRTNAISPLNLDVPCGTDVLDALRQAHQRLVNLKLKGHAEAFADIGQAFSHLPAMLRRWVWSRADKPVDVLVSNLPGVGVDVYCLGTQMRLAMATASLHGNPYKFIFTSFGDVLHGTLLSDVGLDAPSDRFDRAFRENLAALIRLGHTRRLLSEQPHFVSLSPRSLDDLARSAERASFRSGEVIVKAGDRADAFFVIEQGSAEASVEGSPGRTMRAGSAFGEIGILHNGVRTATVIAVEPVEVLRIDSEDFRAAFNDELNRRPVQAIVEDYLPSSG
jgi:diacylglycerol O-acyltransferase / wax synthase